MLYNHCAIHLKLTQYCKSTLLQFKKNIFFKRSTPQGTHLGPHIKDGMIQVEEWWQ